MKTIKIALLVMIGLVLSACGDRLVFVTKTSVGVDFGLNGADNGIHIGFKRFEGIVDPLKGCADQDCTKGKKAQSLLAKLNFGLNQEKQNDSVSTNLAQWIATGEAATILARRENTVLALTGKDIKLATSFQQGIDLSQLSLWGVIYDQVKASKQYNILINLIDTKSKSIVNDMFVVTGSNSDCCFKEEEDKINTANGSNYAYPFRFLIGKYGNCNEDANSGCYLKSDKNIYMLSLKIDKELNNLLIEMLNSLNKILKEK